MDKSNKQAEANARRASWLDLVHGKDLCQVCNHPAKDVIEKRIESGEDLKSILVEYPKAVLAYHRAVCMEGKTWPMRGKRSARPFCVSSYCLRLEVKEKRFKRWAETANTKIQHIHFHNNAGANVAGAKLIPDLDHSGCANCTFICKNVRYIYDSFPGLRSVIEQRNKQHLEYASGDGDQGRIPGQYHLMWCEVGGWGYNKLLPAYSKASNQKFSAALKAAKWLGEEEQEKQREFIDYYKDRPERLNRIKNGDKTAIYECETQDYYKYYAIRKTLRTYYKFPFTIERSCKTFHCHIYVLLEDESTLGKWPGPVDKYPDPLYSIAGIYERSGEKHPRPTGLQGFDEDYETVEDEYGKYEIEGSGKLREKEDNLSCGLASRDKERDPGDYAVANDDLEQEYEGDTRGEPYRKRDSYVNKPPYRKKINKKHASQVAFRCWRNN